MQEITPLELELKIKAGEKIALIDVREPYEHEEYDIGGMNIPLADIPASIDRLKELGDVDMVLYCRSGNRSTVAQKILAMQFNIHNTLNLKGGLIAWREAMKNRD